jgi:Fe-S cluster biogenesis protein NfuA
MKLNKPKILEKINIALDKIRPYLQADGGDIVLIDVSDDLIVKVQLTGSCESCPFSMGTLKAGVEESIRRELPEVKEVIEINSDFNRS